MSNGAEVGTQTHDNSSDTIDLSLRQALEMDSQEIESATIELTLRSVDERIKQAIDSILWRVEELCALLASRTELKSAGNSEGTNSRRYNTSISLADNRQSARQLLISILLRV